MEENRQLRKNLWYQGAIHLGIIGFWLLTSAGWFGFDNWWSYYRFAVIMINKTGLMAMIFTGRFLLFPRNRSPLLFGWALGSAVLILFITKISGAVNYSGISTQLSELGDGLVWCLYAAWLIELMGGIFLEWSREPIAASALPGLKRRFAVVFLKLGVFIAGVICFFELYLLNFLAMEMIPISYFLLIPLIGSGFGLYGVFSIRMNRWLDERVKALDDRILQLAEKEVGPGKGLFPGAPGDEIHRFQLLLLWRSYLKDLRKPGNFWGISIVYMAFGGLIISLPYWIKVVIEV